MSISGMTRYLALLLFQRWVGGEATGYTEELHLLSAPSLPAAQAQAEERGKAQETNYLNEAGQQVAYCFLHLVDVQAPLFAPEDGPLYTRSFAALDAYREVANLPGLLWWAVTSAEELPALAQALRQLLPELTVKLEPTGLGFEWQGRPFGNTGAVGMRQNSAAWASLSAAQDAVLEGMGEDGQHPGALATASCVVSEAPTQAGTRGWRLALVGADGAELRAAIWAV